MPSPRRIAPLAVAFAAAIVLGVPAALGQSAYERKNHIDSTIAGLQHDIAHAKGREGVLSSEIEAASSEIDAVESQIGVLSDRLAALEHDLAVHRERLALLEARYREQTRTLERLVAQHEVAEQRLEERLVELYETEQVDELDILLQVDSLSELIEQVDYFNEIGRQDQQIADEIERLKVEMRIARRKTAATKAEVAEATAVLARKTEEERAARQALLVEEAGLEAARGEKQSLLAGIRKDRHAAEEDLEAMLAASAALASTIQAAQGSVSSGPVSASGFIWPTSGVVTSGFGLRWGRMHEGIDIAAPAGTPIVAAAAGTVIYAGALGGYGNIVVVDHGGGLSTAYAHLSAIWVGGGSVSQGQGIGAVGCTGSCTGNHLHFEVRVNGSPVDPIGYL